MRELTPEEQEVRRQDLRDLQDAVGWQWLLAACRSRKRGMERTIARSNHSDVEDIRYLQGQWSVLEQFLSDPLKFGEVVVYEEGEKIHSLVTDAV